MFLIFVLYAPSMPGYKFSIPHGIVEFVVFGMARHTRLVSTVCLLSCKKVEYGDAMNDNNNDMCGSGVFCYRMCKQNATVHTQIFVYLSICNNKQFSIFSK